MLVISRFSFESWSWVLIASVQDLCILFTFTFVTYSTGSETFISFTLTNVEFRKSRDFFAWILRGSSVGFAWN